MKLPRKLSLFLSTGAQHLGVRELPRGVESATTFFSLLFAQFIHAESIAWRVLRESPLIQKLFEPYWRWLEGHTLERRQIDSASLDADRIEGKLEVITTAMGERPHILLTVRYYIKGRKSAFAEYSFYFEAYSGAGVPADFDLVSSR